MFDALNRQKKYSLLIVLVLISLILIIYWQVQDYPFIHYDDQLYVTGNYRIQHGISCKSIADAFTDVHTGHWHPLVMMSHMLDWQVFGAKSGGHHWTNVILHIFNTVLLFFLFRNYTGAVWRSALVAALFAIHPINVESVAWVAERKNVLSTLFWILTMLSYGWYVQQPNWKRYLPVFVSLALGLMSKPMLVTLPFVLLLMDYWPLNRTTLCEKNQDQTLSSASLSVNKKTLSFLILEKVPLFALTAISILITFHAAQSVRTISSMDKTTFIQRVNNAFYSYAIYLKKLFWPADLSVFYPYRDVPVWQVFIALLLVAVITIFVCRYFRKYPFMPVGWFWYLGTLVPVIGLVQVGGQSMADRYAYVTFVGLFIMIAWGMERISTIKMSFKNICLFAVILSLALLSAASYQQTKRWSDTITLFEDALKKNPNNYLAYQIMGLEMYDRGENERALYFNSMALKVHNKYSPAYNNKGLTLMRMGRRDEALICFEKAVEFDPYSAEAHYNIGQLYLGDGNLDQSIAYFLKAIETKPDYPEAYNNLGVVYVKKGRIWEGIIQFEKALSINPYYKNAWNNLQVVLKTTRKESH